MSPKRELQRWLQNMRLKWRWRRAAQTNPSGLDVAHGLDRCDITYINLDHRTDRRERIEAEFAKIGAQNVTRFAAHKHARGATGCAMSHRDVIEAAAPGEGRITMVCEDDLEFLADRARLDHLIETFYRDSRMDVLCLAYNRRNGIAVSEDFLITSNTRTMSCYLVKPQVIDALRETARKSVKRLEAGEPDKTAAVDVTWQTVQRNFIFALARPRAAQQAPSYSDILGRAVDYNL
jgi:glycosyl transferase family 25